MEPLSRFGTFIRNVTRRETVERELDDELRAYVELLAADMIKLGASPDDAHRAALLKIGGFENAKERVRDERPGMLLENASRDLRLGVRLLRRSPGFAVVAILTIALGIGATSAIFNVINAVALKPLPYPASDQLVFITSQVPSAGLDKFPLSPPEYLELQRRAQSYAGVAAYRTTGINVSEGRPERVNAILVTPNLFDILGVRPRLGAGFTAEHAAQNAAPVVIISDGLWRRAFDGDGSIIGKPVEIQGRKRTVVGVAPPGLDLHDIHPDVWIPLSFSPNDRQNYGAHSVSVVARLKPGVSAARASAEMRALLAQWASFNPGVHTPNASSHPLHVTLLREEVIGNVARALWILQGAVMLVLLIACANVANLLLVRAESRQREFAIRTTLGASRGRILRQYVAEGFVLTALGAALGLLLSHWGLRVALAVYPGGIPRSTEIVIDPRVIAVTTAVAALTAVIFGLAPLLYLKRDTVAAAVRDSAMRNTTNPAHKRVRQALLVGEVALAVMLVIGAGLLVRSFRNLTSVDAGFDPTTVVTFGINLPTATYAAERRKQFAEDLTRNLRAVGGIENAATIIGLPPDRPPNPNLTDLEHVAAASRVDGLPGTIVEQTNFAGAGFFETMGIAIRNGRGFVAADATGGPVVIINEAMARQFYPNADPVGRRLRPTSPAPAGTIDTMPWFTIIGVAADVKQRGLGQSTASEIYYNLEQALRVNSYAPAAFNVVVRSRRSAESLAPEIGRVVRANDPGLPVIQLRSMERVFGETLARQRFLLLLLVTFGGVALTLAAVGTYGVVSYLVTQRRREIGIRVALGAGTREIVRLVVVEGIGAAAIGIAIGLAGALALGKVTQSLLFAVSPTDPGTYGVVAITILAAALVASLLPAHRALRIDPLEAIRSE